MFGFLVRSGCLGSSVRFDQDEARRVILLLNDVKARDSGFLQAFDGIRKRGFPEIFYAFGFYLDLNMND
jgi:hypothetical protein